MLNMPQERARAGRGFNDAIIIVQISQNPQTPLRYVVASVKLVQQRTRPMPFVREHLYASHATPIIHLFYNADNVFSNRKTRVAAIIYRVCN